MTKTNTIILTLFINIVIFPLLIITSLKASNKIYFDILGRTGNNDLLVFGNNGGNEFAILVFVFLNIITLSFIYYLDKKQDPSSTVEGYTGNNGEIRIRNLSYSFFTTVAIVIISIILFGILLLIASHART